MPAASLSREEVIHRLLRTFRESGYQGASLARLSAATGLGKASLYHYFPGGKEDMARSVLTEVANWLAEHVLGPLQGAGTPMERLNRMILKVNEFYQNGEASCLLEIFGVGEAQGLFGETLKKSASVWQSAIAAVLVDAGLPADEAGIRAEDALIAIQGSLVIARVKGSPEPFTRTLSALPDRLLR